MRKQNDRSFGCVGVSTLIHSLLALGITLAPAFQMIPEGTVASTTIDFTTVEAPKGQQTETADIGKIEEKAPSKPEPEPEPEKQEVVALPTPPAPPAPKKMEAAKLEPQKAKAKIKTEVAPMETLTESPVVIEESPQEEALGKEDEFLEEIAESEEAFQAIETAGTQEQEGLENQNDEPTPENKDQDKLLALQQEQQDPAETEVAKEEPLKTIKALPPVANLNPKNSMPEAANKTTTEPTTQPSAQKITKNHQSDMNFGVPTGARNVTDLRQAPGNIPPQYPRYSRLKGESGKLKLLYYVTSNGQVSNLRVIQSSGYSSLDNAAVIAIQKYRFYPGQAGHTYHSVNFNLQGTAKPAGGRLRTSSYSPSENNHNE